MSQSCHCRGRSDVEISHKMFRIRRSLPKILSDPARLPRPLQGLAMTSATFSTSKRINEMYRPASRTVHFEEKKERERKKRKSMKKRGGAIYGRHRIRAGDCPARTAPAHWPMLLALRSAPHRPCCQTRWAGGTSCRSARW